MYSLHGTTRSNCASVIVCQSGRFRLINSMGSPWSLTAIERELKLGGKGRVDRGGELPPQSSKSGTKRPVLLLGAIRLEPSSSETLEPGGGNIRSLRRYVVLRTTVLPIVVFICYLRYLLCIIKMCKILKEVCIAMINTKIPTPLLDLLYLVGTYICLPYRYLPTNEVVYKFLY